MRVVMAINCKWQEEVLRRLDPKYALVSFVHFTTTKAPLSPAALFQSAVSSPSSRKVTSK